MSTELSFFGAGSLFSYEKNNRNLSTKMNRKSILTFINHTFQLLLTFKFAVFKTDLNRIFKNSWNYFLSYVEIVKLFKCHVISMFLMENQRSSNQMIGRFFWRKSYYFRISINLLITADICWKYILVKFFFYHAALA